MVFAAAQPQPQAVEIYIDHGSSEQGQRLAHNQSADDRNPQRPVHFRARSPAQSQRQPTQQSGHGGHHDGTEAQNTGFVDGISRLLALRAFHLQGHINHHDGVLFYQPDQKDDADCPNHVEFVVSQKQRQQRAHARRRNRGENRDGVNVALIEHAQHDVHGNYGGDNQDQLVRERILERSRGALETGLNGGGKANRALGRLDGLSRLAQRNAGGQVKGNRHRRKLALVIHRQRYVGRREVSKGRQGYGRAEGRPQVNILQRIGGLLELRRDLHDHVILVERTVNGRDLPLSEGIVKRIINVLRGDAQPAGGVAVDHQLGLQSAILLVGIHVAQFLQHAHFRQQSRRPAVELVQIFALQRVLILRIALATTDGQILSGLQIECGPRHDRQLAAKAVDHVVGGNVGAGLPEMMRRTLAPLGQRLQHDKEPALIGNRVPSREPHDRIHGRILHDDFDVAFHLAAHGLEGNILRRLYRTLKASRVLLRKKALGHDVIEVPAQDRHQNGHYECDELVVQNPPQRVPVGQQRLVENPFAGAIKMIALLIFCRRPQELCAHGRRGGQRDQQGNSDGNAKRDRELAKKPSHNSAHHEQRNEHRHQRQAHGNHGKANLGGSFECRLYRAHPALYVTRDVFEHHDGIIHNEAGGNRQRHERQIVQTIAQQVHASEGADQRERHGDAGNNRRSYGSQKRKHHQDHQHDREQQREFNILHRSADRDRAIQGNGQLD